MNREGVQKARLSRCVLAVAVLSGCATTQPLSPRTGGMPLQSPLRYSSTLPVNPVQMIVVDAGHGGHDPGTSHYGLKEKQLALDITRRLRTALEARGITVVMTRETDQFIPLSGRPALANRLGADVFVSVHINANHNQRVVGSEVYYPRQSVVAADAAWPPDLQPSEVGIPSTTVKQILWDLVLGRMRSQSRRLASSICQGMRDGLPTPCNGTQPARFVVLREAWMPAVLVEVGYVTNRVEAERLSNPTYRQTAAESIAKGIVSYIRELGVEHI